MAVNQGLKIHITGIVQGVGFRPFIYTLAKTMDMNGWVRNTSAGVDIQVDGNGDQLDAFIEKLKTSLPPLAKVDTIQVDTCNPQGFETFEIFHSESIPGAFIPISPDVSICDDCLFEMFDPSDNRYLYPFINCTNCGPRFTIINDIPYDRPKTTMAPFEMCDYCLNEYNDPLNRRFHAQPVACPDCGPQIWLETTIAGHGSGDKNLNAKTVNTSETIQSVQELLADGKIIAIKGLGGFHLACDATNQFAVRELRNRKLRIDKPFALMMADLSVVNEHCSITSSERELLLSRQRPIVLLDRRSGSTISLDVAPGQNTLGVMLPYTPLHHLLFREISGTHNTHLQTDRIRQMPLVMTSGNFSEEPIAFTNQEARVRLSTLADAFLLHNREIRTRCDDSVIHQINKPDQEESRKYFLRRSRGYAPDPIQLPINAAQILAVGPELKNTFCLTKGRYAFLSHHIGDMENFETLNSFTDGINHFENLFRIEPQAIVCDLHPNYLSTRYAIERSQSSNIPLYQIQHHHAHIASCMVDNNLHGENPIIGIAFDGTGYGDDGLIWGGEFLIADYCGYQRYAHLENTPLPGGDSGTKKPYRIALAQLLDKDIDWDLDLPPVHNSCSDELSMLRSMINNSINTPLTSSMGRFFDAVSALIGVKSNINYEAQAAIELESIADPDSTGLYPFKFPMSHQTSNNGDLHPIQISSAPLIQEIVEDFRSGKSISSISGKFHHSVSHLVLNICRMARDQFSINEVALSGGVWQNILLLQKSIQLLEKDDFSVYYHNQVPTNDGGIALGQAIIGVKSLQS